MDGFLNLDKPKGLTSHDCVARVRRLLQLRRVGHGGTLDPAATGVLPIAIGRATRLLQYLPGDKAYDATLRFGVRTTTDDLEGEILYSEAVPWLELDTVKAELPQFEGLFQQIPPSYSAIQVGGKRLYDLARAGQVVEAPVRTVEVHQLQILDWRPQPFPELDLAIACGSGTYIRAIARDLGEALKVGGTLAALRRTASSGFTLQDSLTLEDLEAQLQDHTFQPLPPETALQHLPAIALLPELAHRWCQGQKLADAGQTLPPDSGIYRVNQEQGQFLGLGQLVNTSEGQLLIPKLVFAAT